MINDATRSASVLGAMTMLGLLFATGCAATSTPQGSAVAPQGNAWAVVVATADDPNELEDELPAPSPVDRVFREIVPTSCYASTSFDGDLSSKDYVAVLRGESAESVAEAAAANDVVGAIIEVDVQCGS